MGRLEIRRNEDATVIGHMREDGLHAAVHIADDADVQTIAGQLRITQLRVLAETITRRRRGT